MFTVKAGLRLHARASYATRGEALRRREIKLVVWRAACAAWETGQVCASTPGTAVIWRQHHPRPAYPA